MIPVLDELPYSKFWRHFLDFVHCLVIFTYVCQSVCCLTWRSWTKLGDFWIYFVFLGQLWNLWSCLMYNNFAIQNYLKTGANISKTNIQNIFCLWSESLDVAQNFSKKYQNNITCQHEACPGRDDQKHLYESCAFFTANSDSFDKSIEYEEIFKNNVQNQLLISRKIFEAYNKREQYISFQQRGKIQRNPDFFQVDPGWQELIEDLWNGIPSWLDDSCVLFC